MVIRLILIIALLLSSDAVAFNLLDVEEVSLDVKKINKYRNGNLPQDAEHIKYGGSFNLNLSVLKFLHWDNRIHMAGTDSQIRYAGWEFRTWVPVTRYLQIFYYHHSEHVLEREMREYPIEDAVGVRLIFLRRVK
jgi:hypothetical protein